MARPLARHSMLRASILTLALVAASCGDEGDEAPPSLSVDTPEGLRAALEQARSGDVITLEGKAFEGNFVVPAGVTLDGDGASFIATGAVFKLTGGQETPTRLTNLTIESRGVGILASGGGEVQIDNVSVAAITGVGVAAEALDKLTMESVALDGPIEEADLPDIGGTIDGRQTAIAGLIVSGGAVELARVDVTDFAGFGAVLFEVQGSWSDSTVSGNVGTSVLIEA